jgi:hypothetical protein
LRLLWRDEALVELEAIADYAPRGALHVVEAAEWLVASPFPHMHRELTGRPGDHVLSVPPFVVFYTVRGDLLTVVGVEDARRRREPW